MDDGHINPDHPLLKQMDTLFWQLAKGGAIPTENDIKLMCKGAGRQSDNFSQRL
jgi:hypothetical protein